MELLFLIAYLSLSISLVIHGAIFCRKRIFYFTAITGIVPRRENNDATETLAIPKAKAAKKPRCS
jgi:hypothetical protein